MKLPVHIYKVRITIVYFYYKYLHNALEGEKIERIKEVLKLLLRGSQVTGSSKGYDYNHLM